jgi:hypothetical protein
MKEIFVTNFWRKIYFGEKLGKMSPFNLKYVISAIKRNPYKKKPLNYKQL